MLGVYPCLHILIKMLGVYYCLHNLLHVGFIYFSKYLPSVNIGLYHGQENINGCHCLKLNLCKGFWIALRLFYIRKFSNTLYK